MPNDLSISDRIFPKKLVELNLPFCIVGLGKVRGDLRYIQDTFADKSEELRHVEGSLKDPEFAPWDDGNFQIRTFDPKTRTFSEWVDADYNDPKYMLAPTEPVDASQVQTFKVKVTSNGKAVVDTVQYGGDRPKSKFRPVFRVKLHFGDTKIINGVGQGVYREQWIRTQDTATKQDIDVAFTVLRCDLSYGIGLDLVKYVQEQAIDGKPLSPNTYWRLSKEPGEKGKFIIHRMPETDMTLEDGSKVKGALTRYAELTALYGISDAPVTTPKVGVDEIPF